MDGVLARVVLGTEPADVERPGVVIVVRLDGRRAADLTGLADETPGPESACNGCVGAPLRAVALGPGVLSRGVAARVGLLQGEPLGAMPNVAAPIGGSSLFLVARGDDC